MCKIHSRFHTNYELVISLLSLLQLSPTRGVLLISSYMKETQGNQANKCNGTQGKGGGSKIACATKGPERSKRRRKRGDERNSVVGRECTLQRGEVDIRWCATSNRCPSNNVQPTSLATSRFSFRPAPLSSSSFTFFRRARLARDSR